MTGVQCYELFGGIALKNDVFHPFMLKASSMSLLLSYHRRLRMILRSARAARGRRSGLSQLVYVCDSHGYGGLDGGRDGVDAW